MDRLDRVDDHQIGRLLRDLGEDIFEVRFAVHQTSVVRNADALGPHLDLVWRLFTRYIQRFQIGSLQGQLQAEGRFPDARFSAQQDDRARNQSATQDPIDLSVAQIDARKVLMLDFTYRNRPVVRSSRTMGRMGRLFRHDLFDKGVPFAACRAAAHPFGRLIPAVAAKKRFFELGHD